MYQNCNEFNSKEVPNIHHVGDLIALDSQVSLVKAPLHNTHTTFGSVLVTFFLVLLQRGIFLFCLWNFEVNVSIILNHVNVVKLDETSTRFQIVSRVLDSIFFVNNNLFQLLLVEVLGLSDALQHADFFQSVRVYNSKFEGIKIRSNHVLLVQRRKAASFQTKLCARYQ